MNKIKQDFHVEHGDECCNCLYLHVIQHVHHSLSPTPKSSCPPCVHELIQCSSEDAIGQELPTNRRKEDAIVEAEVLGSQRVSRLNG